MANAKLSITVEHNQIKTVEINGNGKAVLNALLMAMEDNEQLSKIIKTAASLAD